MKKQTLLLFAGLILMWAMSAGQAHAQSYGGRYAVGSCGGAYVPQQDWHRGYYHTQWGRPLALVLPPTVCTQTNYSWGVAQTTITPVLHQYGRSYPGAYQPPQGTRYRHTPMWPSHTDQFGVYYIRGPWGGYSP